MGDLVSGLLVVNASPLIFLGRAGLLDLLRLHGEEVVVPEPVMREVLVKNEKDALGVALRRTAWLKCVPAPTSSEAITAWDLGAGESSVIAFAVGQQKATVALDDLAARKCARSLGLPVRGALGLVITAQKRGLVSSARETLSRLRVHGMWLSDGVVEQALREAGLL